MLKKLLLIGLLGISLVTLFVIDASALGTCILRNIYGGCRVWSGSIECGISVSKVGNVTKNPETVGCTASGTGNWVVACGNPGVKRWTSPGINLVYYSGSLEGNLAIQKTDVDHNGNAYLYVPASADQSMLNNLTDTCPNPNWIAIDAAPCEATVTDQEWDACNQVVSDTTLWCTLPSCETLGWDKTAQQFERREYECTILSQHLFPVNACPSP